MDVKQILAVCDHTLLSQSATEADIRALCDDGMRFGTASVCIPPCYVKMAKEYVKGKLPICTVVGFPNGYATTATKVYETENAVKNGADEIDMVINVGLVKNGKYAEVLEEIRKIRAACEGKILKVIIETCLLTYEEKVEMTKIVSASGADYIKTSTGFAGGGATVEDIVLFEKERAPHLKIKAAGGISSLADAEAMLLAGAQRLGTSRIVRIAKQEKDINGIY